MDTQRPNIEDLRATERVIEHIQPWVESSATHQIRQAKDMNEFLAVKAKLEALSIMHSTVRELINEYEKPSNQSVDKENT